MQAVRQATMAQLANIGNPSSPAYKKLLQKLILQGMVKLEEDAVVVQCREMDKGVVQDSIYQATQMYSQKVGAFAFLLPPQQPPLRLMPPLPRFASPLEQFKDTKPPQVSLDTKSFLKPPPQCAGGVRMHALGGRIVCNNTLDARLAIAYEQNLPSLRRRMFGKTD